MSDISQKHHVQANAYCMKCQKEHDFDFAIGGILKLVLGAISRDEWVHMLEKYQVSHLNGVSDDGYPLNHILGSQTHNKSRQPRHHSNNLAAYPERIVCRLHEQPCFLATARMVGRWPQVTAKMITQHQQGHPAINAFDLIKHKMFE